MDLKNTSSDSTDINFQFLHVEVLIEIANPNYTKKNIRMSAESTDINGPNPTCWGCLVRKQFTHRKLLELFGIIKF